MNAVESSGIRPDAVILLGRGGYSSAPQEQLAAIAQAVRVQMAGLTVTTACVDQGATSLPDALTTLALAGARTILVLAVFVPSDQNLQRWLAKVIARWHAEWLAAGTSESPRHHITVHMAEPLGNHVALGNTVAAALHEVQIERADITQKPPKEWQHDPAGWGAIPEHSHHVLLCRGPRCTARGADRLWNCLHENVRQEKAASAQMLAVSTSCLFPCNLGPVLVVHPAGIWYGRLTEEVITRIVREHLAAGQAVAEHIIHTL